MWPFIVSCGSRVVALVFSLFDAGIAYIRRVMDAGAKKSAMSPPGPPPQPQPPPSGPVGYQSSERYPLKQKSSRGAAKPYEPRSHKSANFGSVNDGVRDIQTTKRHIWLLDLTVGEIVTNERLAAELHIEPAMGWHADRSITLAVLVEAGSFYAHTSGPRLRISPRDYLAATMPPISHQAVPILSEHEDGWRFEGFFRLGHPRKTSVACCFIHGAPPELLALKNGRATD
jgi:hypothetical protein